MKTLIIAIALAFALTACQSGSKSGSNPPPTIPITDSMEMTDQVNPNQNQMDFTGMPSGPQYFRGHAHAVEHTDPYASSTAFSAIAPVRFIADFQNMEITQWDAYGSDGINTYGIRRLNIKQTAPIKFSNDGAWELMPVKIEHRDIDNQFTPGTVEGRFTHNGKYANGTILSDRWLGTFQSVHSGPYHENHLDNE